jgi:hypothetical protein
MTITGVLVILFFGFPAVFVSLLVSAIGVWKGKYWPVVVGALLFIPFSYYLNGAAHNNGLPFLLPLFQILSAAAVREKNKPWAWILLAPSLLVTLYILAVVLFFRSL